MITLRQLAYQIHNSLAGGYPSPDSPYKDEYIVLSIRQAMNEVMQLELRERRGGIDDDRTMPSQYISSYTVDVQTEVSAPSRDYIDLPDFYASLKYNKGIHAVAPLKRPHRNMIPLHHVGVAMQTQAGRLESDNDGYYIEGLKIYWPYKIKLRYPQILLKLIVAAPDKYGEDDVLPVSPGQLSLIRDRVVQLENIRVIQDKISDDNKDIQVNVKD